MWDIYKWLQLAGILLDTGNLRDPHCTSKDKYIASLLINGAGRYGCNGLYQLCMSYTISLSILFFLALVNFYPWLIFYMVLLIRYLVSKLDLILECVWFAKEQILDMTIFVVFCLIYKLIKRLDKIDSMRQDKNKNFCPLLNHMTTFCPQYKYKKYENTHFIFKYKNYYFSISLW
jgi:hypothetical protein